MLKCEGSFWRKPIASASGVRPWSSALKGKPLILSSIFQALSVRQEGRPRSVGMLSNIYNSVET